ncbi:MAG: hypothetical protein H0U70_05580 [Tatlockia sp.]|nr:hypothetical protein [Tatlockia sp.]
MTETTIKNPFPFHKLVSDLLPIIVNYLTFKNSLDLMNTSKTNLSFFKDFIDPQLQLVCVAEAKLAYLKILVNRSPAAFFQKGQVTTLDGTIFYKVSPFQLMHMLYHDEMKNEIMPLIPDRYKEEQELQWAQLNCGGADLVKLDFDPGLVTKDNFNRILEYKTQYKKNRNLSYEFSFSLLQNPDGLLYYQDAFKIVHLYYANRIEKSITEIPIRINSALTNFLKSFEKMENNSARRSTNNEHHLIMTVFNFSLQRKGICFEKNGELTIDNNVSLQLISAYRKCLRLYKETQFDKGNWSVVKDCWLKEVGAAQRDLTWVCKKLRLKNVLATRKKEINSVLINGIEYDEVPTFSGSRWFCGSNSLEKQFLKPFSLEVLLDDFLFFCKLVSNTKVDILECEESASCLIQ